MLTSHGLRAAAKKGVSPSITYQTYVDSGTAGTSYTFSNVSIGGPGLIVVTVHAESNDNTSGNVSSATIGGVTATIVQNVLYSSGSGQNSYAGIISAVVTSGTTANIVINLGSVDYYRCGIGVWRIQNYSSPTAAVSTSTGATSSSTSRNLTLSAVQDKSVVISGITLGTQGQRVTWTNLTERYDTDIASGATGVSGGNATATSTGDYSITASYSTSSQAVAMVAAAWL